MGGRPTDLLHAWATLKNCQTDRSTPPGENERFASHGVSRWNPYERRIQSFRGLLQPADLTRFRFAAFTGCLFPMT